MLLLAGGYATVSNCNQLGGGDQFKRTFAASSGVLAVDIVQLDSAKIIEPLEIGNA